MRYPAAIERLIEHFMRFPGIGRKTAERYAFHVVHHVDAETATDFGTALRRAVDDVKPCVTCGFLTDKTTCDICKNPDRERRKILVVEESKDAIVIEKSAIHDGLYHVLNGVISPSDGVGPEDLNLKALLERLKDPDVEEVILAMNFSEEGETTAMYIDRLLENSGLLVTRIAYGMPAGGNIGYADALTLAKALEGRKKY